MCLRSSARFALVRTSLRESCSSGPGWRPRAARLINSWLVTPIGLVDVTSRYQFRAAGLSMVVTPEMRMSACSLPSGGKGLALVAVMLVWLLMCHDHRLDVLVRLVALVRLEAVGHEHVVQHVVQVVAVPHLDGLLVLRVLAAMRAQCMRLVVVAGQRETES